MPNTAAISSSAADSSAISAERQMRPSSTGLEAMLHWSIWADTAARLPQPVQVSPGLSKLQRLQ